MNIKICGITDFKQMQQLDALNVDFVGINFNKNSARFIGDKLPKKDIKKADFDFKKVGIFVNPTLLEVLDAVDDYGLDVVQLNGNETTEMCDDLSSEVEVIKAFYVSDDVKNIDEIIASYDAVCDYYLFNSANKDASNSSLPFNWDIVKKAKIEKPFFLGGGIGVDEIAKIKMFKHPDFFGINVNGKLEKQLGIKDMALVLQFTHAFK